MIQGKLERDESSRTNHERTTTVNFQWFLYRKGEARAFSLCICHEQGMPLTHQSWQAMYRPLSAWDVELALFRRGGWTKSHRFGRGKIRVRSAFQSSSISHFLRAVWPLRIRNCRAYCPVRPPYAKPLPVNYAGPVAHMRCSELMQVVIEL